MLRRTLCGVLLGLVLVLPGAAAAADTDPPSRDWAVTLSATTLLGRPAEDAEAFGDLQPFALLEVLRYEGEWAYVYNPRTRGTAYVPSAVLGPAEAPSRYALMPAPALVDEFEARGLVTDEVALAIYPTPSDEATQQALKPNTWLRLAGTVDGEDGGRWYVTDTGGYVSADAVFVPERTEHFGGRWLDVDLNSPARVTAYEGGEPVTSFLAIKGTATFPTPVGVFTIIRRVANETMNSDTIGIPRFGPGGYYLTNVLFTQYFTGSGASFHYNYWSGNWGRAGSHGCLGLTYADSAFLWEWARLGTPLTIHY
jgi:hypothetical protein